MDPITSSRNSKTLKKKIKKTCHTNFIIVIGCGHETKTSYKITSDRWANNKVFSKFHCKIIVRKVNII